MGKSYNWLAFHVIFDPVLRCLNLNQTNSGWKIVSNWNIIYDFKCMRMDDKLWKIRMPICRWIFKTLPIWLCRPKTEPCGTNHSTGRGWTMINQRENEAENALESVLSHFYVMPSGHFSPFSMANDGPPSSHQLGVTKVIQLQRIPATSHGEWIGFKSSLAKRFSLLKYPLAMTNIAIENGPVEIVDLPFKNSGSFQIVM